MKETKLETPQKIELFKNYDEVLQRLINSSKIEKEHLDTQINLKNIELQNLNQSIVKRQQFFEQWKREEENKFKQEMNKKRNEMIAKETAIDRGVEELKRKSMEISERERNSVGLVEERRKINNDRIEIEKLFNKAKESDMAAQQKLNEANSILSKTSVREKEIKEMFEKSNAINSQINNREEQLKIKQDDLEKRFRNLEEVKKVVEPKIDEIRRLEENLKIRENLIKDKENEIKNKLEENMSVIRGLEERKNKLDTKERELLQKESDLARKALGIK